MANSSIRPKHRRIRVVRGTPKQLSQKGRLSKFTYLMMNFPFECNYTCQKCFNRGEDNPVSGEPISLNDRLRLITETKKLGGKAVVIAGEGEPPLDKNIKPIISEINSLEMLPIVYSNGSTLTPELIEFYRENNTILVIALDSLNPEVYARLTGTKRQFERVMKNIGNMRKAYDGTEETVEDMIILRIAINATVMSINEKEIAAIKKFCGESIYFICNTLAKFGNAAINWDELIEDKESYDRQIRLARELSEAGGPLTLGGDGLCGYSRFGIGVNPYGQYMTCAYTSKTDGLLGDIQNRSLKDAFRYKYKVESDYYKSNGVVPCLIRSEKFSDYLKDLEKRIQGRISDI